jgi:hypothetical protein
MADLYKYGVAVHIYKPIIKRGVVDFAVGADWTPAAGDVKISKDGAAAANVTNLPTAIVMGNTAMWDYSLTATEMQAAKIRITVADASTKAVEDVMYEIDTYGHASAQHAVDLSDTVRAGLTALPNVASGSAGAIPTTGTGANQISVASGLVQADVAKILGAVPPPRYTGTAQAGAASSITLQSGTTALQVCPGDVILITGGTGVGQSGIVESLSGAGGSTPVAVMSDPWPSANPANGSTYEVLKIGGGVPAGIDDVWAASVRTLTAPTNIAPGIADAVWDELRADHATVDTFGAGVVAAVVNDKTGFSLSPAGIDAILDRPISEPTGPFAWNAASLRAIVAFQGVLSRNKTITSENGVTVRNSADTITIAQASATIVNGVLTRGAYA